MFFRDSKPRPSSYPPLGSKYPLLGTIYPQLRVLGRSWKMVALVYTPTCSGLLQFALRGSQTDPQLLLWLSAASPLLDNWRCALRGTAICLLKPSSWEDKVWGLGGLYSRAISVVVQSCCCCSSGGLGAPLLHKASYIYTYLFTRTSMYIPVL